MLKKILTIFITLVSINLRLPYFLMTFIYIYIVYRIDNKGQVNTKEEFMSLINQYYLEHYNKTLKHSYLISFSIWLLLFLMLCK